MNEILIYQDAEKKTQVEVRFEEDTVWLTQPQIVTLFHSSKANISEHIAHIFDSGELDSDSTVRKFRTVQKEGAKEVARKRLFYNLDMIISSIFSNKTACSGIHPEKHSSAMTHWLPLPCLSPSANRTKWKPSKRSLSVY